MMTNIYWVEKIYSKLTKRRLAYAWIAGGALWLAWLVSILSGSNGLDRAGQVIGTDYIQFYSAGQTILKGDSQYLYDFSYQSRLEQSIIGPELKSFHAFITPPLFAIIFVPLALLPYIYSYIIWSLMGIFFLWLSLKLISSEFQITSVYWSLSWFPVFASISFGQNSLLSLVILSFTFLSWKKEKYFLSGLIACFLFYKPQLLLGLFFLWIVEYLIHRRAKALSGLICGTLVFIVLNIVFLPEASFAYLKFSTSELPQMISHEQFPIWHMHTIRGFWMMLLGVKGTVPELLYLISIGFITPGVIKLFKQYARNKEILFAVAICFTLLITPHAMIYDWALLLIPALLLWERDEISKSLLLVIFVLMWIAAFISGPVSFIQLNSLKIGIQISVPIFILCSYLLYKNLLYQSNYIE